MGSIVPVQSGPRFRAPRKEDPDHLAFIRTLPCVHTGRVGVEACHLRSSYIPLNKPHTGMREKPDDRFVLPMTRELHARQHSMNEVSFWAAMGWHWPQVVQLALDLYEHTGDEETCQALIARVRR